MGLPQTQRYLHILKQTVVSSAGIITFRGANTQLGIFPPHNLNPRFVLEVTDFTGSGAVKISIDHSLIPGVWHKLYEEFIFSGNGTFVAYTEDMATKNPFDSIRANVTEFGPTSFVGTLVGLFDFSNT